MLKILRNGSNFNAYPKRTMTDGVVYTLSQINEANRTWILTESGVLLMGGNSEFDLLFVCSDDNVTFTIGMLAF